MSQIIAVPQMRMLKKLFIACRSCGGRGKYRVPEFGRSSPCAHRCNSADFNKENKDHSYTTVDNMWLESAN